MSRRLAQALTAVSGLALFGLVVVSTSAVLQIRLMPESLFTVLALGSFALAAIVMLCMVIACVRDVSLSPSLRLRWELALVVGGPLTALLYFVRQAKKGA
jgi:hypothetical protein